MSNFKMKKLLPYILILIALVGLWGPTNKSSAQEIKKNCYKISLPEGGFTYRDDITESECIALGGQWMDTASGNLSPTTPSTPTPEAIINTKTTYKLLAPLPKLGTTFDSDPNCTTTNGVETCTNPCAFGKYMNILINLIIGFAAVLAVIMIIAGGLEYMTSELISSKESGKNRITNALLGLVIALGSWALLNTLNPELLNVCLKLPEAKIMIDLGGEGTTPLNETIIQTQLQSIGVTCAKSGGTNALVGIAQSYVNRSTYSQEARNTTSGGKINLDCSSYVSQVYVCAGLSNPGGTTVGIFGAGRTSVVNISADGRMVDNTVLKVGDLLGWRQGENGEKNGHVVMYIGNGQVIDAQGSGVGVGVRSLNSDQFKGRIKYIKRAP